MVTEKRQGGQITEKAGKKIWLVLSESTNKVEVSFVHKCGNEIQRARVAHPIWNGASPCSGSGQCHYETVPFCPNCETEPRFHGTPIDPVEAREMEILRKIRAK